MRRLPFFASLAFAALAGCGTIVAQTAPSPRPGAATIVGVQDLSWSADGRSLFFSAMRVKSDYSDYKPEKWSVYRYDVPEKRLRRFAGASFSVAASPKGGRIAVGKLVEKNRDLYVLDDDGREVTRLTTDPAEDFGPSWSPDGRRIAFTSKRDGRPEVYRVDADGGNLKRLTESGGFRSYNPA